MRIAVAGAGIVGLAIAHALLDEGHTVELIDREGIAAGASRGNAGWVAHTDIMPLASPKAWRYMPRWLTDPMGPLAIRPSYLPHLLPWFLRFVAASQPEQVERGTVALAHLNLQALPSWEQRLAALGLSNRFLRQRGILTVWSDPKVHEAVAAVAKRQAGFGIAADLLDAAAVRRLEPAFGPAVAGGALHPAGLHVADPKDLTVELGEKALARGATLVKAAVTGMRPVGDGVEIRFSGLAERRYDRAVLALGAWSKHLAKGLGDAIPLDTERGYNITLPPGTMGVSRPVMFEGHGFVTTPLDSGDRIGGSVEFAGLTARPNYKRVDAMLARLRSFLPDMGPTEGPRWMGFRPSLPDSLPVIGASRATDRVLYAFGHGHYGLTQAAATADIIAALVAGRRTSIDIQPYSAQRF